MELGIETTVAGEVLEKGMVAIEAKIFYDIVRKLPDSEIILNVDSNLQMTITCEKAKFVIPCKSGEDFSYLPLIERDKKVTLSQFSLKEIIRQTIFSTLEDDYNKLMAGELFEIKNNHLRVVSLDGHRISIRKIELNDNYEDMSVIIPGKTLNEINKILTGGTEDMIHLFFTTNHVLFEFDNTIVVSRLMEGEFFKVDQIISSDYDTKIQINKKEFLDCIDRATLLIKESDKRPIVIQIQDGEMELKIESTLGTMNENIIISKEGKDIVIGFNPKLMIDALRVIDDEEITIYLLNPKAPCFIKNDDESYIYLVLPVNITA
jgi:DNA polymerase-3 subunit beta